MGLFFNARKGKRQVFGRKTQPLRRQRPLGHEPLERRELLAVYGLQAQLPPSDLYETDAYLGSAVAIDGDYLVVGSSGRDGDAENPNRGAAYVFRRDDAGTPADHSDDAWTADGTLVADDAVGSDMFGYSVAISGDTLVIGSPFRNESGEVGAGAIYVFQRSGGVWVQQQKLLASVPTASEWFGWSVGISGDTIVAGSPFHGEQDTGAVYVFQRSGGVWSLEEELTAADADPDDRFGYSVAVSGDTVVVGSTSDDEAALHAGAAYVFQRTLGVWSQEQKLTSSDAVQGDSFGEAVAISGDTVVVGAPWAAVTNIGAAYVFQRSAGVWTEERKLLGSDTNGYDYFGEAVAISGDTVVVGSPMKELPSAVDAGAAYVFQRTLGVWSQDQKILGPSAEANDRLGEAVAVSGDTIVIAVKLNDEAVASNAGAAYVFAPPTSRTVQLTSTSQTVAESVGTVTIDFELSEASTIDETVYFRYGGTATQGSSADYTATGSVAISAGETTGSVTLTINDDWLDENDETIVVTLDQASHATLGTNTVHTVTISADLNEIVPLIANDDDYVVDRRETLTIDAPGVLGNDTADADDVLSVLSVDATGTLGSVTWNADGSFTYDPNGQFDSLAIGDTAIDTFAYTVSDGNGETSTATVTITIGAANHLPIANNDDLSTDADQVLTVSAPGMLENDTDEDGDTLSVVFVDTMFTLGQVTWSEDGGFTYDPNGQFDHLAPGQMDSDSFSYILSDSQGSWAMGYATVTITGVNHAPVASDDLVQVGRGIGLSPSVLANDSDLEGDDLTAVLVQGPSKGSLVFNADGTFRYTPGLRYNGADSFTYRVRDSAGRVSNTATVSLRPAVGFLAAASRGNESIRFPGPVVELSARSATPVTIRYSVTGGTATAGSDYALQDGTLTFQPGQIRKNLPLQILNDRIDEFDQTVAITLSDPSGALPGTRTTHTYTIVDNDAASRVSFALAASSGSEGAAAASLVVRLSAPSEKTVTLGFAASGGSALAGTDYTLSAGTLTFLPGEVSKTISFSIADDAVHEQNETVRVSLTSAQNAERTQRRTHAFTIVDDDPQPAAMRSQLAGSPPRAFRKDWRRAADLFFSQGPF